MTFHCLAQPTRRISWCTLRVHVGVASNKRTGMLPEFGRAFQFGEPTDLQGLNCAKPIVSLATRSSAPLASFDSEYREKEDGGMLVQFHLIAMTDRRQRVAYRAEPDFVAVDWVHFLFVSALATMAS